MNSESLRSLTAAALLALGLTVVAGCRSTAEPESTTARTSPPGHIAAATLTASSGSDAGEVAATVLVAEMRFQPEVVRIKVGQAVGWEFKDPGLYHSVTAFDRSFDSGLRSGGAYVVRFDTPGTYCYQCLPHPGQNLCEQGSRAPAGPLFLTGSSIRIGETARALLAGGGHMQGKIIVEE